MQPSLIRIFLAAAILIGIGIFGIYGYTQLGKISCNARGCSWGKIGSYSGESCNLPTSDAGKECSGFNECEGACIAELSKEDLGKAMRRVVLYTKGKCTAWKITVGCQPFVED